jgi:SAM-dependent methyltransferase
MISCRACRPTPSSVQFVCNDLTALAFAPGAFDAICSYYAIIHIPRQEHRSLFSSLYRLLKPGGLALLCLGAENLENDLDDFLGEPMYWSHYDAKTKLRLLQACGFQIIWSRLVADETCLTGAHLFVLAQKQPAPCKEAE